MDTKMVHCRPQRSPEAGGAFSEISGFPSFLLKVNKGILRELFFYILFFESAFEQKSFKPINRLQNAKQLGETSLAFLVHPGLSEEYINQTCDAIKLVMSKATH